MKTLASIDKLDKAIAKMDNAIELSEAKRYIEENRKDIAEAVFKLYLNKGGFDIELPSYVGYGVDKLNPIPSEVALKLIMGLKEFKGYHVSLFISTCSWKADEVTGYVLCKGAYDKMLKVYWWLVGAFISVLVSKIITEVL